MSKDMPETFAGLVSAVSVTSDFGVMIANRLARYREVGSSPQDLVMVTTEDNLAIRDSIGALILDSRFEHQINEAGYHFLRARREMTVAEARQWLAASPYKPREATSLDSSMAQDDKIQKTLYLNEPARIVNLGDELGKQVVLPGGGPLQSDSKVTPKMYLPVKYKADHEGEYRTKLVFPCWEANCSFFLIELTTPQKPGHLLKLLQGDGLVAELYISDWLEPWLRRDLGGFYGDVFAGKKLINLNETQQGYAMFGFQPFGLTCYRWLRPGDTLEPGLLTLVYSDNK
jgi:hypothetical protein